MLSDQSASAPTCPKCGQRMTYTSSHGYICGCPIPKPPMTRWNCGRCGYLALSSPHKDTDKGTEIRRCPVCGEQWWLDEFTYSRMHPAEPAFDE